MNGNTDNPVTSIDELKPVEVYESTYIIDNGVAKARGMSNFYVTGAAIE